MRRFLCSLCCAWLLVATATAVRADMIFNGFETPSGLTLNGTTSIVSTGDGKVLRLTPASPWSSGSAYSTTQVSTSAFSSVFSFRITGNGGPVLNGNTSNGADGLTFVVQTVANNVGSVGGGMGFEGIAPSMGVEFDTFFNAPHLDPSESHIAIDLNGSVDHDPTNGPVANLSLPRLDQGDRWWSWVDYSDEHLDVYLLNSESTLEPLKPAQPLLSYDLDLNAILNQDTAFAGFASATGAVWSNHDVIYWRYSVVPEPSAFVLAGIGAILTAGWVLRRRTKAHFNRAD